MLLVRAYCLQLALDVFGLFLLPPVALKEVLELLEKPMDLLEVHCYYVVLRAVKFEEVEVFEVVAGQRYCSFDLDECRLQLTMRLTQHYVSHYEHVFLALLELDFVVADEMIVVQFSEVR